MSGTKKHDWPGLIREYVLMKSREPLLTQNEFFRRHGIKTAWGNRKIGKEMELAWEESQKKALAKVVERTGIDLADEMEKQLKASKAGFTLGARNILPRVREDGAEIPAPHQPVTFTESLMLMKTCGDAMRDITKILTGGERLLPPMGKDGKAEAVRAQLQAILKNPKARELAGQLMDEIGPGPYPEKADE
jgi:hypothetical protein